MPTTIDRDIVQTVLDEPAAWPNLTQAAGITGLSKGTLSKQVHAGRIASEVRGFGQGERLLSPEEVLRIGYSYRRVSQATLIERLARFLSAKLSADTNIVQQMLWTLVETAGINQGRAHSLSQETNAKRTPMEAPNWLLEVERLRKDPRALEGTLSFTSADDLIGTIELGPSVDEPTAIDPAAW